MGRRLTIKRSTGRTINRMIMNIAKNVKVIINDGERSVSYNNCSSSMCLHVASTKNAYGIEFDEGIQQEGEWMNITKKQALEGFDIETKYRHISIYIKG